MAHRTHSDVSPWFAFLLGAVIVLAAMLVYMAYVDHSLDAMRQSEVRLIPPAPIVDPALPDIPMPETLPRPAG